MKTKTVLAGAIYPFPIQQLTGMFLDSRGDISVMAAAMTKTYIFFTSDCVLWRWSSSLSVSPIRSGSLVRKCLAASSSWDSGMDVMPPTEMSETGCDKDLVTSGFSLCTGHCQLRKASNKSHPSLIWSRQAKETSRDQYLIYYYTPDVSVKDESLLSREVQISCDSNKWAKMFI